MKLFYRVVVLFSILFGCFSLALASPACPGFFELKQPSGFDFRAKYAHGSDEHHHSIQTEDGYGIYKDKKDGWKYFLQQEENNSKKWGVKKDKNGIRPVVGEVNPLELGIPKGLKPKTKTPSRFPKYSAAMTKKISGDMKVVVIGVYFNDQSYTYSAEEVRDVVLGDGNSVRNYFQNVSYGKIDVVPAEETSGVANDGFVGWIHLDMDYPEGNFSYEEAEQALQQSREFINLADFDKNGDSILEADELAVVIIVAGQEEGFGYSGNSTWAYHSGAILNENGVKVNGYVAVGEIHGDHLLTIGTIAHEFGHLGLDLPDLYDTYSTGEDDWWGGLGYFCLMASGTWGKKGDEEYGESPVHLSAWCKEQLGWGNLAVVNEEKNISLNRENSDDFNIVRINTQKQEEYFLVELRRDEGFGVDGNEIDGGAVIYHVNTKKTFPWTSWGDNSVNDDPNDKGVDVEEAASSETEPSLDEEIGIYESMFYKKGYAFTNETDPSSKLNNGESTFVSITNISEVSDIMTVDIDAPTYAIPTPSPIPTPVQEKEMILEVSINEVKVADNDIVVISKGDWVRVAVSIFGWYDEELMEDLQADKITCQIKNARGKTKYYKEQENSSGSSFAFKAKRRGQFDVEVVAYKTGYETASFQASFKVE